MARSAGPTWIMFNLQQQHKLIPKCTCRPQVHAILHPSRCALIQNIQDGTIPGQQSTSLALSGLRNGSWWGCNQDTVSIVTETPELALCPPADRRLLRGRILKIVPFLRGEMHYAVCDAISTCCTTRTRNEPRHYALIADYSLPKACVVH